MSRENFAIKDKASILLQRLFGISRIHAIRQRLWRQVQFMVLDAMLLIYKFYYYAGEILVVFGEVEDGLRFPIWMDREEDAVYEIFSKKIQGVVWLLKIYITIKTKKQ